MVDRPGQAAIAVITDTSVINVAGSDYGFDHLFARQIEALGNPGDIFIAYSASGNSKNIINGLKVARSLGLLSMELTGDHKGLICSMCDHLWKTPSSSTLEFKRGICY